MDKSKAFFVVLMTFLFFAGAKNVFAAATVTPASGGGTISADSVGGPFTSLTGPTVLEDAKGDIHTGTIVLNVPTGFVFSTVANSVTASVTSTSDCSGNQTTQINNASFQTVTPATSSITITVTRASSGSCVDEIVWSGIAVAPTANSPLASGKITYNGGSTITGVTKNSTNFGTLTEINPVPTLVSISPAYANVGGAGFTLTVTGTNFVPSSVVKWNSNSRTTTFVSSTTLTAVIPSSDISNLQTASITVTNPSPGGGTSGGQVFTVQNPPAPTIISISPTSAYVNGAGFTMTVNGTNFTASSIVEFNSNQRTTTFVSSTQLTAIIPSSDLINLEVASITVVNPSPYQASNGQNFTVGNPPTQTATSIVLTSSATSSVYGNSVTFTATVTPTTGGPPSGTVTFKDGATTLGTGTLNGATPGTATFTTSTLSVAGSPHSVTAIYGGDSNFLGSTSTAISQTIAAKPLTVSGITAANKLYDASTTAILSLGSASLVGVVAGDTVNLQTGSAQGTFATSSVGSGILVTVSGLTISGSSSSDYSLTQPTTTATISPATSTVTVTCPASETYTGSAWTPVFRIVCDLGQSHGILDRHLCEQRERRHRDRKLHLRR